MKTTKSLLIFAVVLSMTAGAQAKPKIKILATGGTIAGAQTAATEGPPPGVRPGILDRPTRPPLHTDRLVGLPTPRTGRDARALRRCSPRADPGEDGGR